tara:strand:- start:234 stop:1298 length:1065 start_codon:yes stop_codon:yes gene_type:complete
MRVHQVVLEGPRIEPTLSNTPLTTPSNITSVEIQQSPIKGADGKPLFKVVDQNGKVLFTGSEADANTKLDSLRKNIPVNAPTVDKNKLGGVTKAADDVPDKSKLKTQQDFAQNKKATQVVADLKARNPLKKWISSSKLGSITSIILSAEQLGGWADEYLDTVIIIVNEGKQPKNDPRLRIIRVKIAEEILTSFIAYGGQIALGGAIVNKLKTLTLLGAAVPGAGWVSAAITGALYISTSIAIRVASEIFVSKKFMEPIVDYLLGTWFNSDVIDSLARDYGRLMGKAVPKAESRVSNYKVIGETENAASISSAGKDIVSSSSLIQQALKKAKEQGINKNNAANKLDSAIEDKAAT